MTDTRKDPTLDREAVNDRRAAVPTEASKTERTEMQKSIDRAHAPSVPEAGHAIAEQSQEEHDRIQGVAEENKKEFVNATGQKVHRKHKKDSEDVDAGADDDVDEDDEDEVEKS